MKSRKVRSLTLRHVDAGSCNGCEQELTALLGPDYDIQREGVDIVASPRHADALLVTGPVTDTMLGAMRRVYEAIPAPKIRVAFGDCAMGCGLFQHAYASHGGLRDADMIIPGCPPTPQHALQALRDWVALGPQHAAKNTPSPSHDTQSPPNK